MAILSQTKQGFITFKTVAGYMKWLPRTLASLVTMNDGKSVEEKITQLNGSLSNKVTSKYSSEINHCHNVKNMVAGQTILNVSATTTSQVIFTKAQLNSMLGVSNASEVNTVIFVCNNDGSVTTHFDSATYLDGKWYVVANKPWGYTQIRLGYLVIYFG